MIRDATIMPDHHKRHLKTEFLGVYFDDLSAAGALDAIILLVGRHIFSYVVTPNVDHVVALNRVPDAQLVDAYAHADLTLCDSRILGLMAQQSGLDLHAVPGSDLTRELLDMNNASWRCAVIGGDAALHATIAELYPQHVWVFHQPPMGVRRNAAARQKIADFVENAEADFIFFAIGAPQSEICCHEIVQRNQARGVALCIGASLEFLTGAKKRAPNWMQQASLEWLHRLCSEPARLWRRYLVEGPRVFRIWKRWQSVNDARRHVESGSTPSDGR
jgi:exopolysaccharide biosynthesis WecB/TagA/CpsF family protein